MIPRPRCTALLVPTGFRQIAVRSVRFEDGELTVAVQGEGFAFLRLRFRDVLGFRALDEGELVEFWPEFSEPRGWLWEVHEGGCRALESQRPEFLSFAPDRVLREFLVVDEMCLFVLCPGLPEFVEVGA